MAKLSAKYNIGDLVTLKEVLYSYGGGSQRDAALPFFEGIVGEVIHVAGNCKYSIYVRFTSSTPTNKLITQSYWLSPKEIEIAFTK